MIHLLEIDAQSRPAEVRKFMRRYAMTGGVELALRQGLKQEDLHTIAEVFAGDLGLGGEFKAAWRTGSSYRILKLVRAHPAAPDALLLTLEDLLV